MTRPVVPVARVLLPACSSPPRDAEAFAQGPERAAKVVADRDAGRSPRHGRNARPALAETRRRDRVAAYARTFREA